MSDVLEAKAELRRVSEGIRKRSMELGDVNRALGPVQKAYRDYMRDFKLDLYRARDGQGQRMPSKETQEELALEQMPKDFRDKYFELMAKREGVKERLSDLKHEADSWRSILSAEKVEMEAIA